MSPLSPTMYIRLSWELMCMYTIAMSVAPALHNTTLPVGGYFFTCRGRLTLLLYMRMGSLRFHILMLLE